MKPLAIQSATIQELHDLHEQLTAPNPKTGKRLESGVAVFIALALVLDQRLEEIRDAVLEARRLNPKIQWRVASQPSKSAKPARRAR